MRLTVEFVAWREFAPSHSRDARLPNQCKWGKEENQIQADEMAAMRSMSIALLHSAVSNRVFDGDVAFERVTLSRALSIVPLFAMRDCAIRYGR